eukprot:2188838-Prorocentrum_lima.AAC.1
MEGANRQYVLDTVNATNSDSPYSYQMPANRQYMLQQSMLISDACHQAVHAIVTVHAHVRCLPTTVHATRATIKLG